MIQPEENAGGDTAPEMHESTVPFTLHTNLNATKPVYKPYGEILQLDWTPQEQIGGIVIPKQSQAKMGLPFFRVKVLAAGPDCKMVKVGDYVIIPQQVILHAKWDGDLAFFTSENKIVAVVE